MKKKLRHTNEIWILRVWLLWYSHIICSWWENKAWKQNVCSRTKAEEEKKIVFYSYFIIIFTLFLISFLLHFIITNYTLFVVLCFCIEIILNIFKRFYILFVWSILFDDNFNEYIILRGSQNKFIRVNFLVENIQSFCLFVRP